MSEEHKRPFPGAFECVCGAKLKRNEQYDSYYCIDSFEWVESICSDLDCDYCVGRPENAAFENEEKQKE